MNERPLTRGFGVELDAAHVPDDHSLARSLSSAVAGHRVVRVRGLEWDERRQIDVSALMGTVLARYDPAGGSRPQVRYERGVDLYADRWHADGSWASVDTVSLLYCTETSSRPDPTAFLDTVSALAGLAAERRAVIAGREVTHDLRLSRHSRPASRRRPGLAASIRRVTGGIGRRVRRTAARPSAPPLAVPQPQHRSGTTYPLIDRCPATGTEFLRLGDHAHSISGLGRRESSDLLDELHHEIDRPETTWSQCWEPGDLVVYDNRMVLHRRAGAAGLPAGRVLRRTMVDWVSRRQTE